jgi:hypothetical protein
MRKLAAAFAVLVVLSVVGSMIRSVAHLSYAQESPEPQPEPTEEKESSE